MPSTNIVDVVSNPCPGRFWSQEAFAMLLSDFKRALTRAWSTPARPYSQTLRLSTLGIALSEAGTQ